MLTTRHIPEAATDLPEHLSAVLVNFPPTDVRRRASLRHVCDACHHYSLHGENLRIDDLDDGLVRATIPRILELLGGSPWTSWLTHFDPNALADDELLELLQIGRRLPPRSAIEAAFDGWPNVLRVAGYGDVAPPSSRGRRSVANDGHACFSDGERMLDDWLTANGVPHSREPLYPGSNYRGDFLVHGKIVEYFGMFGDVGYMERMEKKASVAAVAGVEVVAIYPKDLMGSSWISTQDRLASVLGFEITTRHSSRQRTDDEQGFLPQPLPLLVPSWYSPVDYDVPPGFYPDPLGKYSHRWNDGHAWTFRVKDGTRVVSDTPTVDDNTRAWASAKFRLRKREGGVVAAGEQWLEEADERIWALPEVASGGEPDLKFLARLSAVMDLAENASLHLDTSPHRLAAEYFSAFRMRGAELAVHRRHADHIGGPIPGTLFGRGHAEDALTRRGHQPDLLAARFAVRGTPPTETSKTVETNANDVLATSVLDLLRSLGIEDALLGTAPGEGDRILLGSLDIRIHSGPLALEEAQRLAASAHTHSGRVLFIDSDVSQEVHDQLSTEYIALVRLNPSGPAVALNWDANDFFEEHCDDDALWVMDPEFWERN